MRPAEVHRRKYLVSHELLAELLGIPEGVTLVHIVTGFQDGQEVATVYVDSPDWPAIPEGRTVPLVYPSFERRPGEVPVMVDWGARG